MMCLIFMEGLAFGLVRGIGVIKEGIVRVLMKIDLGLGFEFVVEIS